MIANHKAAGFALAGMVLALPAQAQQMVSNYTHHDYETCRRTPGTTGYAETTCTGFRGVNVIWATEADSTSVVFGKRTIGENLFDDLGAFEVGDTIEWRGRKGARPIVAIVRYRAGATIDKLDANRLVVHSIGADGVSCIIGDIDGRKAGANATARKLADALGPTFRCGQDKRVPR